MMFDIFFDFIARAVCVVKTNTICTFRVFSLVKSLFWVNACGVMLGICYQHAFILSYHLAILFFYVELVFFFWFLINLAYEI